MKYEVVIEMEYCLLCPTLCICLGLYSFFKKLLLKYIYRVEVPREHVHREINSVICLTGLSLPSAHVKVNGTNVFVLSRTAVPPRRFGIEASHTAGH
jgi:hypothetical protein